MLTNCLFSGISPKADLEDKLRHAFLDAVKLIQIQQNDSYIIQNQNRLERIPCKNIMYITRREEQPFMTNLPNDSVYRERKTIPASLSGSGS